MTAYNMTAARQVIIHGDCWPVVSAVAHLTRAVLSGGECEATYTLPELLQQLHRKPQATLVLCLRPREHIFLFYALKEVLLYHPALVISDELLFSDRVVLHNWGELPAVLHQELTDMATQIRQHEKLPRVTNRLTGFLADPKPATGLFAVPLIFNHPTRLMNYMTLLMYRATVNCGVTPDQQKLLEEVVCKGQHSLSGMTTVLNKNKKQIWQDKNRLLVKLGMRNRLRELFYGTRLCESQQLTPFMMPGEVKQDRNKLNL
ncbi:transcriptional regulator [Salmonella enterica subsp. enterica]|uniref:Transcriptional regulator n=2 Tax=Salmonella enterica TaxID=28901 RepID=A0A744KFW7_SALER|nr:transcriptional regulator [Salmonella enterica subsp. enterica serovar Aqua]ECH1172561.1 transcriptional regulator [Salmonella enterica subsp. enterica serovar Aqua]HAF2609639.1 transcriptional regulator [Salmonella enterica]